MSEHALALNLTSARAPAVLDCHRIQHAHELAAHFRIREQVFVHEQALFVVTDRDVHDDDSRTIHVLGLVDGEAAGAVRLYPVDSVGDAGSTGRAGSAGGAASAGGAGSGVWKGDRLAVLREQRRAGIGRPLVRCAVALAAERGGSRMDAQVQIRNVAFFKMLGWSCVGEPFFAYGVPHQQMSIALR